MRNIQLIAILAGHGKSWYGTKDPGAVAGNLKERDINVEVGRSLVKKLKERFPSTYIQGIGIETEASIYSKRKFLKKCIAENGLKAEKCLAIHLHCNAATPKAKGVEAYSDYADMANFGSSLTNHMSSWFNSLDRGLKVANGTRAGYISSDGCPSILLELGFLSNKDDRKYLTRYDDLAETIAFTLESVYNKNNLNK